MAALKFGTNKVISRYLTREYEDIFRFTGIDTIIGYHLIIANEITKGLISESDSIMKMKHSNEFFYSTRVEKSSPIYDTLLGDLVIPEGVRFAAIVRDGRTIYPKYDTRFEEGDRILLFTYMAKSSALRKLLGKSMPGI